MSILQPLFCFLGLGELRQSGHDKLHVCQGSRELVVPLELLIFLCRNWSPWLETSAMKTSVGFFLQFDFIFLKEFEF